MTASWRDRQMRLVVVVALLAALVFGCERAIGPEPSAGIASRDILRRGNGGEPGSLDPALAEDVHAFNVLVDLYEGLVSEAADGSLRPGVAARWEVDDDGRRYTFYLRDDARWSTGERVTAADFVAAFRRVAAPGSVSPYAFLLEPILNFRAVAGGSLSWEALGITASDDGTLVIELESPLPYLPGILTMPIAFPMYRGNADDPLRFREPEHFVGNGPYVLGQWDVGERIRLHKNVRFRDAQNVAIEVVDYLPIVVPNTELNMFRAGELDITNTVPPDTIADLRRTNDGALRIAPSLGLYYLAFDLTEAPFDEVALRRALTMAIDRNALVTVLGRGERPAYGIVPPGVADHRPARFDWQHLADAEREFAAREWYARAGYGEADPLQVTLTYDVGDVHETVAVAIASMWRDVLGVDVNLDKREWKLFLDTRDNRSAWQVMRFAWVGDYNDATTFTDLFRSDSAQNLPGYRNDRYDALLDEAGRSREPDARSRSLHDGERILLDDYAIAPLYFYVSKHLVSSRVTGFENSVLDKHPSRYLVLKPTPSD